MLWKGGVTEGKEFNSFYPIVPTTVLQYMHLVSAQSFCLSFPFSLYLTVELSLIPPLPFPFRFAWEDFMLDFL